LEAEGLSKKELIKIALETGFIKRKSKKIEAYEFLELMCIESQKGSPSFNDLASRHETVYTKNVTKQAFSKKVNQSCVLFFQTVLARIITSKISKYENNSENYNRVLIQDSTIIKLPRRLFKLFSGVSNAHTSVCNARIQGVYDIISGTFVFFSIDPYSKNDISVAPHLEILKGDLSLRDRGYYLNSELKRHLDVGADCIFRYKSKTMLISPESGKAIDVLKLLKSQNCLDMQVCLNDNCRTKVRLVAAPVCEEVANQRRMKAKKENKGHNPSDEILALMAWTIYLTTIPKEQADFTKIHQIYGLRWRIETIFKSWKSNMLFDKVHNVSEKQLRIILTARFIMIVIFMHYIYNPWLQRIRKIYKREISMSKLIKYLVKNPENVFELLAKNENIVHQNKQKIDDALIKYCTYDKRKRLNFSQLSMVAFN